MLHALVTVPTTIRLSQWLLLQCHCVQYGSQCRMLVKCGCCCGSGCAGDGGLPCCCCHCRCCSFKCRWQDNLSPCRIKKLSNSQELLLWLCLWMWMCMWLVLWDCCCLQSCGCSCDCSCHACYKMRGWGPHPNSKKLLLWLWPWLCTWQAACGVAVAFINAAAFAAASWVLSLRGQDPTARSLGQAV